MEQYKKYKETYPHKSDAQIIEALAWELKDKVETIHRLLDENEALRRMQNNVVESGEQLECACQSPETGHFSNYCPIHN